jgi:TetR/AcrR family fatty acid metabolism transcriptional regulator
MAAKKKRELTLKGQKTKEKILDTALELFSKYGYNQTTITEISNKAGIAEGTIYIYYQSKEKLMLQAINKAINIVITEIDKIIGDEPNPLAKFYAFFEASINVFSKRPDLARFIVIEQFNLSQLSINDAEYTGFKDIIDYVKKICEAAVEKGYLREVDIDILVFKCHGMIDSLLKFWIISDYQADMLYVKNKLLEMLMFGLVP